MPYILPVALTPGWRCWLCWAVIGFLSLVMVPALCLALGCTLRWQFRCAGPGVKIAL